MKLILSVTLISWMLFSTAGALQCQQCENLNCSVTKNTTCDAASTCLTSSATRTLSGFTDQGIFKLCVPASSCAVGNQTFSQSAFNFSIILNVTCCNTDNCNSQTLSYPAIPANNNLQCYACDPTTPNCARTPVQCKGVEDRCFRSKETINGSTTVSLGCTSVNLCTAGFNLPVTEGVANMSCCGTNLCNTAPTTTTTTMYLLLGFLVFSLY